MRRAVPLALAGLLGVATSLALATPAGADEARDYQWYLKPLGVEQAWNTTKGRGVTACVIDSGVDTQAPDIGSGVVAKAKAFTDVGPTGTISPHGTGVAAFLAGRGHGAGRDDGVIGTAPQVTLLSAVVNEYDRSRVGAEIDKAARWCVDNGATVLDLTETEPTDGGMSAGIRYAQSKGAVVVASAGNTFETVTHDGQLPYPARLPGVVAVSGINRSLRHDGGSTLSTRGKPVSLAAPMTGTDSTGGYPDVGLPWAQDRTGIAAGKTYDLHSAGTSWSAPIVSGIVAMIRAAHPSLDANGVINTLLRTATPTGSGHPNRTYGWGIVDAAKAVASALPADANPLVDPSAGAPTTTPTTQPATFTPATAPSTATRPSGRAPSAAGSSHTSHTAAWIGGGIAAAVLVAAAVAGALRVRRHRAT